MAVVRMQLDEFVSDLNIYSKKYLGIIINDLTILSSSLRIIPYYREDYDFVMTTIQSEIMGTKYKTKYFKIENNYW
jgi:hypothetical protein